MKDLYLSLKVTRLLLSFHLPRFDLLVSEIKLLQLLLQGLNLLLKIPRLQVELMVRLLLGSNELSLSFVISLFLR